MLVDVDNAMDRESDSDKGENGMNEAKDSNENDSEAMSSEMDEDDDFHDGDVSSDNEDEGDESENKSSGLANVMSKILGKNIADNKVILAKAKTDREILSQKQVKKAESDSSSEDESASGTKKPKDLDDDEYALKREQALKVSHIICLLIA